MDLGKELNTELWNFMDDNVYSPIFKMIDHSVGGHIVAKVGHHVRKPVFNSVIEQTYDEILYSIDNSINIVL